MCVVVLEFGFIAFGLLHFAVTFTSRYHVGFQPFLSVVLINDIRSS